MKLPVTLFFALLVASTLASPALAQSGDDFDGVMVPLNHYLMAHATGDGEHIRQAFHPDAKLFWVTDGALTQLTAMEFASRFSGEPAADESERKRRIVNVEITGDVAVAKIELDYPQVFFTDYMTLVKIGDEWKIINKSFQRGAAR